MEFTHLFNLKLKKDCKLKKRLLCVLQPYLDLDWKLKKELKDKQVLKYRQKPEALSKYKPPIWVRLLGSETSRLPDLTISRMINAPKLPLWSAFQLLDHFPFFL